MNTDFDSALQDIDHYKVYPAMIPFVGSHYVSSEHPRVLLFGESNYLPKDSTVHLDAEVWYKGSQNNLNDDEINWINCQELLNGKWNPRSGHKNYININKAIESVDFGTGGRRGMDHVAFMNAFQRPSPETQGTMKGHSTDTDILKSSAVIGSVIKILEPDCVIFTSKYAWGEFHSKIGTQAKVHWVNHPTSPFQWPKADGRDKFIQLLKDIKK